MNSQHNQQSIGILARLCAQENITIRHKAGLKTASFDVKNRVLYLPIWAGVSRDLIDMLIIHEVGHALDTPADGWIDGVKAIAERQFKKVTNRKIKAVHGFANVLEDVRVDKRQKRRFPGSVRNYVAAYKELFQRDFFQINNRDLNSMAFIDRLNIFTKGGALLGIHFTAVEKAFIVKAQHTETFPEVLALTEEVFAWSRLHDPAFQNDKREKLDVGDEMRELLKELLGNLEDGESEEEEMEGSYPDISDSDEDEDDAEDSDDNQEDSKPGQKVEKDEDGEEGEGEAEGDADADGEESEEDSEVENQSDKPAQEGERDFHKDGEPEEKKADDTGSEDEESDDEVPESETESAWDIATQTFVAGKDDQYVYVNIPEPNLEMIADDYKKVLKAWTASLKLNSAPDWRRIQMNDLNAWKAKEAKSISYLLKEFDMKKAADIYVRSAQAKTGRIDTNKLHAYKYSEDIFKRITLEPKGTNHGFFMLLDWSLSMASSIHETVKQLISLTLFCKRAQMPFEVYLFRDPVRQESYEEGEYWKREGNYIGFKGLKLRNILSSRMSQAELQEAMFNLWCGTRTDSDPLTYTPLNEAVVASIPLVNRFRKEHNLQIVNFITLTDGGANTTNYSSEAIREVYSGESLNSKVKTTYIIQDKVSRKEIYTNDNVKTAELLDILKTRTGANVLGFYIFEFGWKSAEQEFVYRMPVNRQKGAKAQWEGDKFLAINSNGYDEYYILNFKDIRYKRMIPKEINDTMTKKKIEKAFMENVKASTVNRVLLRQFAEKIAREIKVA